MVKNVSNWMTARNINCSVESLKKILIRSCPLFTEESGGRIFFELLNKKYPLSLDVMCSNQEKVEVIFNNSMSLVEVQQEVQAAMESADFYQSDEEYDIPDITDCQVGEMNNTVESLGIQKVSSCVHLEEGQYNHLSLIHI